MPCYAIDGVIPVVHPSAFVHPTAVLIGDVIVGPDCYIGPAASLRGRGRSGPPHGYSKMMLVFRTLAPTLA